MGGDLPAGRAEVGPRTLTDTPGRVVRVAVDVPALADQGREFDYRAPPGMEIGVGTLVRVPLAGRRVGGWVVATDVAPPDGIRLAPVAKVTGLGAAGRRRRPGPAWAAWRWAGRRRAAPAASPLGAVTRPPSRAAPASAGATVPVSPTAPPRGT